MFGDIAGAAACRQCGAGEYSATSGASVCGKCLQGTFSAAGASNCTVCAPGSASSDGLACVSCKAGEYTPTDGSAACQRCETAVGSAYTSTEGSAVCNLCRGESYMDVDGICTSCLEEFGEGAICAEGTTLSTLVIKPGFFRTTPDSKKVYTCTLDEVACPGGNQTGNKLCADGYEGPLCNRSVWSRSSLAVVAH